MHRDRRIYLRVARTAPDEGAASVRASSRHHDIESLGGVNMAVNLSDYSHTAAQRGWGPGWPSCSGASGNLAVVTFGRSGVRVSVHKRIARLVQILADETERRGYLAKLGQTGAYNCRAISGTNSPSNHSWGLAIDWNWTDNPFTTNWAANHIPSWMPPLWNHYGFAWGGNYTSRHDFMHFEAMGSLIEMDDATGRAIANILGQPQPNVPIIPSTPTATITWIQEADMALPVLYPGDGVRGARDGRGALHWYVLSLQALLAVRGLGAKVVPSGEYDAATVVAVKELQTRQKIIADGTVGPATWPWVLGNLAPDYV